MSKKRINNDSSIRAREAVTGHCPMVDDRCMPWCAFHPIDGGEVATGWCELLPSVPRSEDPRDWYLRMVAEALS